MAEVMNMSAESLDTGPPDTTDRADGPSPPPPPPPAAAVQRRRDIDFRDRKDEKDRDRVRDFDRPPNRQRGGDYYERNLTPPPRDRERDFKRRRSPSPSYRDRRRSPFKRFRRDDGGFERKGGFGPEDRRLGYDNVGERGMGGRHGFSNNRSYSRLMNRSMGPSELEPNRGGYSDSADTGARPREGLMSYKQFIQELEDDILPAEAERRYQEYKSEYISTQKRAFFDAHKDEEWLRDKYHPTNLLKVIEQRNDRARQMVKDFLLDLQSGTLDLGPSVNAMSSHKFGQSIDPNSDDEVDASGKRRRHGRGPVKENDISAAPKAHPVGSESRRIHVDIEQSLALVQKLDSEKGIADNILSSGGDRPSGSMAPIVIVRGLTSVKGLEGIELLDTLITYLWRIHGLDFYGMVETSEPKGFRHVRVEGKGHEDSSKGGAEWEKNLDSHWKERLKGQDPLELLTAKEKIDAAAVEVLDPHVRKIRDEKYGWKYGCGAKGCTKLFHAAEFVHKHLKLKHPELVMELTSKLREDLYFENYMNDHLAPGGTPVMQQPSSMEKVQRRKLSLEDRLRDERGKQREPLNSPSSDKLAKAGLEGGNIDESMYDAFAGAVAPFPSDMAPPPVLMPVPGAGPLGPFVPAPPEVAMLMMREQGGPSPYEGNGRVKLSGSSNRVLGQDSRRMRSYQDLDAPDDEVTVIDYRSL